jgi:hypothetical protein
MSVGVYSKTDCVGGPAAGLAVNIVIFAFFELWELWKVRMLRRRVAYAF